MPIHTPIQMPFQTPFVGRATELGYLKQLPAKRVASFVVITGRRRIGKSRLVEEFGKGKVFYTFSGLAPTDKTTAQDQREEFARQIHSHWGIGGLKATDWGDLLDIVVQQVSRGKAILFFDEISWMGSLDPTFLGKLKIVWDLALSKNPKLIFILCGSVSSWIEKNILSSTGYFGRVTQKIALEELKLPDCKAFFEKVGFKGSTIEALLLLAITGGVPWYLELIHPGRSMLENIKQLCFTKDGILVDEYRHIFHDLFGKRNALYQKIVETLASGALTYQEISHKIHYASGGPLSEYLNELILSGFIRRELTWNIQSGHETHTAQFRISDNYLRFYLKYIKPSLPKIKRNQFQDLTLSQLTGFHTMMGFQFENLILNNRELIFKQLGLTSQDIVNDNPYFQKKTSKQAACQIDYLIQTRFKTLYLCEIKFSKNPMGKSIIAEMQEKIKRLSRPKGFACLPVLIHVSRVSESVVESDFFAKIIDVSSVF